MRVRFGPFVFDSATRELLRELRPVHLSPKSFDLLQILIERRPALVTKSELQDQLWPDARRVLEQMVLRNGYITELADQWGGGKPYAAGYLIAVLDHLVEIFKGEINAYRVQGVRDVRG